VFSPPRQKSGQGIGHGFQQNLVFGAESVLVIAFHTEHSKLSGC